MGDPTFWDDPEKAQKTAQDVNSLKEEVDGFHKLSAGVDDLEALQEMAAEENDESLLPEMDELLAKCRSELEHLELGMLLSGEYDANNAILTLHAQAAPKRRTGPVCCCVCLPVLLSKTALRWKCSTISRVMRPM